MTYKIHLIGFIICASLLAACAPKADIERGIGTAVNGEIIKTCFDKEITPDLPGYLDISALPDLTKAGFASLAETQEESRLNPKPWVKFSDNHDFEPVGYHPSPVRNCWENGDPRKSGLYRYRFGSISQPNYPRAALYKVYFRGEKAVYVEGWVHK